MQGQARLAPPTPSGPALGPHSGSWGFWCAQDSTITFQPMRRGARRGPWVMWDKLCHAGHWPGSSVLFRSLSAWHPAFLLDGQILLGNENLNSQNLPALTYLPFAHMPPRRLQLLSIKWKASDPSQSRRGWQSGRYCMCVSSRAAGTHLTPAEHS